MITVEYPSSPALLRRCREIQDAMTNPYAAPLRRARVDLAAVVEEDHRDMILRGVDRYGVPRVPTVRERTPVGHWSSFYDANGSLRRYYQAGLTGGRPEDGSGPSLAPHGELSRVIQRCEAVWEERGGQIALVKRFVGIVSKKGVSFMQYHLTGSPESHLPRRDVGGITPKGWVKFVARHKQLVAEIAASGRV